jgi:hypothetical protein
MKKSVLFILFALMASSCNGWSVQPLPYNPPTPFMLPTRTPAIFSPTPVVIGPTSTSNAPTATVTPTFLPTSTNMPSVTPSGVPVNTYTPTSLVNAPALQIVVLGCNTSIDISHGMGEVTNAYVTLKNVGNVELTKLIATLYTLDEGREHPDKIQEISSLPIRYETTLKMTVDSTYKEASPIQVEVSSDQGLFPREGLGSCRDIGLFAPKPDGLNTPIPSNP